jgi:hypothetical protein
MAVLQSLSKSFKVSELINSLVKSLRVSTELINSHTESLRVNQQSCKVSQSLTESPQSLSELIKVL